MKNKSKYPKNDMCKCSDCGNEMKLSDCHGTFDHHDGWELPPYYEYSCVHCDDGGCIDDYFPSLASIKDFQDEN